MSDETKGESPSRNPSRPDDTRPGRGEPSPSGGAVAIVGAGMRFPGGVVDGDGYWSFLTSGADAVREVPPDRWDADAWTSDDPEAPGKMLTRQAGFLDDVAGFDAAFFGIAPKEAIDLDPAQRLLLQTSWEALEDAGMAPDRLEGRPVGVYVGLGLSDYGRRHFLSHDAKQLTPYAGTGAFLSVAAGRISYALGLHGPAMTVDTACSSSLVSVHLAVEALRAGKVEVALAGGANLILAPEPSVYFSKLSALAPDGRCKAFDASADGYGRGEGVGMVVLKRLEDAVAQGDPIIAVIRGTAVNHDGRSNGLTAPSGRAQQELLRSALHDAGLSASDVGAIEAHGTGTPLGDPIEFDALRAVFGARSGERPLFLTSVKTNFGHLETAAGVAGLIRMALSIRHGAVPPHLHLRELNPRVRLDGTPIQIPTEATPWDGPRVGGVSSFGLSGTNAHVLLSEPPQRSVVADGASPNALIVLSAKSAKALKEQAGAWASRVADHALADVAHTSLRGRSQLPHRLAVVASDTEQLGRRLSAHVDGAAPDGVVAGEAAAREPELAFLFTGQGAQRVGMGQELYDAEPAFREALDRCFAAFEPLLPRPLKEVMWQDADALNDTRYTQPALYALETALAALLRHTGVEPDVVAGHSIGEIAAAVVAGAASLEDGARLVAERGRLMSELPREGAMLAVFAPEARVLQAIETLASKAEVSGINNPTETVLSGPSEDIEALAEHFDEHDVRVVPLVVSHAFHSALMEPILDAFEAVAASIEWSEPDIPVVSDLDGEPADERLVHASYWRQHLRHAVRFADAMETMLDDGVSLFVELGPRPVLSGMGQRCAGERDATFVATLHPKRSETELFAEALGSLWGRGVAVDLDARVPRGRTAPLPKISWQQEDYWLEARDPSASSGHPYADWVTQITWRSSPVSSVEAAGRWAIIGDDDIADALASLGATCVDADDPNLDVLVFVASHDEPRDVTARAIACVQRLASAHARVHFVAPTHCAAGAGLRGVGRSLQAEQPQRWGGFVQVRGSADPDGVARALAATDAEDVVEVRDGNRRVGRLVRSRSALDDGRWPIDADGAYLITGGFGAFGRAVARRLISDGARHVVLSGRRGLQAEGASTFVEELRGAGASVEVVQGDVSNADDAHAMVAAAGANLRGVVHCAGASADALIASQTEESVERVFAAKVRGARNLDEATASLALDFFVLVSSAAGVLGVPGQTNYAAANAELDALARARREAGRPATSVAFGPLAGTGIAGQVGADVEARWAREGVFTLDVASATSILSNVAVGGQPDVVVAPFEWALYRQHRVGLTPFLSEIAAADRTGATPTDVSGTELVTSLRQAPQGARLAMLKDHLQQVSANILGFSADRRLGDNDGFFDAGMDSLMAVDLREKLVASLGRPLSATVAFDHPSVATLADHLLGVLDLGDATAADVVVRSIGDDEPIAIVGASCRFPGGADGVDAFWSNLMGGVDGIGPVPAERFDVERYYASEPGLAGKLYCRDGGFVEGIDTFEPEFFGISPREADSLDPQQRLLLEVAWHALEDAAIAPDSLRNTRTGVYVGVAHSEYWHRFDPRTGGPDAYAGTGNESSFAPGRLSYVLGTRGPSVAVNTACSSSLVTVHSAVQALRRGQCDVAVAGGVNAIVGPQNTLWMSLLQALAPDGRCKAFDARADGYVRAEGCGMVVLKRLSDAERDGDAIYAVVRGSAVNHDGPSSGLTVPNGAAQQQVLRAALGDAGVDPTDVGFVECHGTGTRLGDPIEVGALGAVMADGRPSDQPLRLGAVKAHIGHLEAGAGIAGFIKAMLALERESIPGQLHVASLNPSLPMDDYPALQISTDAAAWPRTEKTRFAGVSSFGISGTNAHVVLQEAPKIVASEASTTAAIVVLSARTPEALAAQAARLHAHLTKAPASLADVAWTLSRGRAALRHRTACVAGDVAAMMAWLHDVARGEATVVDTQDAVPPTTVATSLQGRAEAWLHGADVAIRGERATPLRLPGTVFVRTRHWVEDVDSVAEPALGYVRRWTDSQPALEPLGVRAGRTVLVFADDSGVGDAFAARQTRTCQRVRPGSELFLEGDVWSIDPHNKAHYEQLFTTLGTCDVVHLWSLNSGEIGLKSALFVAQAGASHGCDHWWVTRGAVAARGGESPSVHQAPLIGFAQVMALEHPDTRCVVVDLDPSGDDNTTQLETIVHASITDGQWAIRGGTVLHAVLAPVPKGVSTFSVRADSTYWITGGFGAIGGHVARWLASEGAGAIVLSSRREPTQDVRDLAREVEAASDGATRCVLARGDVASLDDVRRLKDEWADLELPQVRGVFHAAGLLRDGAIAGLEWESFEAVAAPKWVGATHIAQTFPSLDAFVLFSSAASLVGNAGQANYAAANASLDAFAEARCAAGDPTLSVCWGPWSDAGQAVESSRDWQTSGVRPLDPSKAIGWLASALEMGAPVLGVMDVQWDRWASRLARTPSLVQDLLPAQTPATVASQEGGWIAELRSASVEERRERVANVVAEAVGGILGQKPSDVDRKMGFFDVGMDSLMAVELAARLKRALGIRVPGTIAFDQPNVDKVVTWALGKLDLGKPPAAAHQQVSGGSGDEPIAVVGLSCRMPGGANDPEAFWALLRDGVDAIAPVPAERWDMSAYYDPDPGQPGKMYVREGGFVDWREVESFDPEFFGISPREADAMDPQQRMLLEVSYEALEHAGIATDRLEDARTGVYVGVGDSGYLQRFQEAGGPLYCDPYAGTGNLSAFVSGRIAYALGLQGPNLALNTACSSSLVATHLACQALRAGECRVALAGGVHLMLSPENFVYVSQLKAVSPDGRCKTFDASANGYGRSEGCGMVALKRLSDAQADGDRILAVIRGTACGHDGPSSGLTVPYGPAQVQVLQDALRMANVDPSEVSYIETHGTGTVLGDPIEVGAIAEVYCHDRTDDRPLRLGSVKANVGHLELAAGSASLIKMVMAMQHRELPAQLHVNEINPELDLEGNALVIGTETSAWADVDKRVCGISSFGLAGTNVHLLLEEAPVTSTDPSHNGSERPTHVLTLSARSKASLSGLAERYADVLASGSTSLPDVAFSAATTRNTFEERLAIVADTAEQAAASLRAFAGGSAGDAVEGTAMTKAPRVAFLFSGQGSQYAGMGAQLYGTFDAYRQTLDRCAEVLDPLLGRSLIDAMHGSDDALLADTAWTQPTLFALEVSLAALWQSWGVTPAVVAGHSIGQLSAAVVAGALSLEDGLKLVAERGRLMAELPAGGAMFAVFADEPTVLAALSGEADVGIAAINNPGEVTISGHREGVDRVVAKLADQDVEVRALPVSHAFHSPLMEPMLDAFESAVREANWQEPRIPLVCNLTGKIADAQTLADPTYWRDLVRQPVRFADGLATLGEFGCTMFVEVGPHTALVGMGRRTLEDRSLAWLPSLKRGDDTLVPLLSALSNVWALGGTVDWAAFDAPWNRRRVELPVYVWDRRRHWLDKEEFPQHQDQQASWLVDVAWKARPSLDVSRGSGDWLIVGDTEGAASLASAVDACAASGTHATRADAADAMSRRRFDGVVFVADDLKTFDTDAPHACAWSLMAFLAELDKAEHRGRLVIVTQGAVDVDGAVEQPLAGTLHGLARVIRIERADLEATTIDADPAHGVSASAVVAAVLAGDDESEVAIRGDVRHVARLQRTSFSAEHTPIRSEGAYVVTGGLGGLGLRAAQWLVDHGARALVLTGRSAPKEESLATLQAMQQDGVDVAIVRGDVAVADDVARVLDAGRERGGLRGVVHAAGVLADGALMRLTEADFSLVFGPKVMGTHNLLSQTTDDELDFVMLFSGGASMMGAPGQANYAAANAYLDASAPWARANGQPVVAVNWGAWADVGMAARLGEGHAARQKSEGLSAIPLAAGMDIMGRLLGHTRPQVGVLPVAWQTFVDATQGGRPVPFLSDLVSARTDAPLAPSTDASPVNVPVGDPPLIAALRGKDRDAWSQPIASTVEGLARGVLRFDDARAIDPDKSLLDMGLDSLLAVDLKNRIFDAGVDLPVARVMAGPSVVQLTRMIEQTLDAEGGLPAPDDGSVPNANPQVPAAPVEGNSWAQPRAAASGGDGHAAPFNPVVSHVVVFVVGIAAAIVGYVLTAQVSGFKTEIGEQPQAAQEETQDARPAKRGKRGKAP